MDKSAKISPSNYFVKKFKFLNNNNFKFVNSPEFSIDDITINFETAAASQSIKMNFAVSRISYSFVFKFLLPLLFITAISFALYGIKESFEGTLTLLLSMTVFSLVVNDSLPVTPYLTFYDALYFISFVSIFIYIFLTIFIFTLFESNNLKLKIALSHLGVYLVAVILCTYTYFY